MNKFTLLIALSVAASPAAQAAQTIGAAAAVRGGVSATAPKASARTMKSGGSVYFKDSVKTDNAGRMQVLLKDETTFTVGPKSEMVIDEFVYDPASDEGQVSAKITKGAFRFVTGRIARKKPKNMKVKLPVGTIGIRGTIVAALVGVNVGNFLKAAGMNASGDENGSLVALVGPGSGANDDSKRGQATLENPDASDGPTKVTLHEPGKAAVIQDNGTLSPAFDLPDTAFDAIIEAVGSKPRTANNDEDPAKDEKADESTGQDSAKASGDLKETESTSKIAKKLNTVTEQEGQDDLNGRGTDAEASGQSSFADGNSIWSQVQGLSGQGSGSYSLTSGSFNQTSPGSHTGTVQSFSATVNFDSKQVTAMSLQVESTSGSGNINDSTSLSGSFSYASETASSNASFSPTWSNSSFSGSSVQFKNASNTAAKQVTVTISYSNGSNVGNGSATAER